MAAADRLLERLNKVRQTGSDTWIACCPAHDDKTPSLSIKRVDGRVLVHCFAGCGAHDVLAAVDLRMADLFDEPLSHHRDPVPKFQRQRRDQALEALKVLKTEALVVLLAADRQSAGWSLTGQDLDRLHDAHDRILRVLSLVMDPGHVQHSPPPELKRPLDYLDEVLEEFGYGKEAA